MPSQSIFQGRAYDVVTYADEPQRTLHTMKRKWPNAHIVHVAAHRLGSRGWTLR